MASVDTRYPSATPEDLGSLYTPEFITALERVYGHGWLSPGGIEAAREFFVGLNLRPGQKVLDIGSGSGGAAFYLARQYGVNVQGVDYTKKMIDLSTKRLRNEETLCDKVTFTHGDILQIELPPKSFDVIYSKDILVHIKEKDELLKKIKNWLKPGGKLQISDFCRGETPPSQLMMDYLNEYKFDMITIKEYEDMIKKAGFTIVTVRDDVEELTRLLQKERKYFIAAKECTIQDCGEGPYESIASLWEKTEQMCRSGEHSWGFFLATK